MKNRFFVRTLLAFVSILLLLALVFGSILYGDASSKERAAILERRGQEALSLAAELDGAFGGLDSLGEQLSYMTWVQKAGSTSPIIYRYFTMLRMGEVASDILLYESLLPAAERLCIYLPLRGQTITRQGWEADETVLSRNPSLFRTAEELDAFHESLRAADRLTIGRLRDIAPSCELGGALVVYRPLGAARVPRSVVYFIVREEYIASLPGQSAAGLRGFEIRWAGEPIFINGAPAEPEGHTVTIPSGTGVADLSYAAFFDPPPALPTPQNLSALLGMFAGVLAAGLVLAYVLARLTYRPIRRLTDKILGAKQHGGDDFQRITRQYDAILDEKSSLEQNLAEYRSIASYRLLTNLLYGAFDPLGEREAAGLPLSEDKYYCVAVVPGPYGQMPESAQLQRRLSEAGLLCPAVPLSRGELALIWEHTDACSAAMVSKALEGTVPEDAEVLYGTVEQGILGISVSYQNARESVFPPRPEGENGYLYPTDWEIQLINQLKHGNEELALRVLDRIRAENDRHALRPAAREKLLRLLYETLYRVAVEIDAELPDPRNFRQTGGAGEDGWARLRGFARHICRSVQERSELLTQAVGQRIVEHIRAHFDDPGLSLASLADVFGLSQPSVSRLVKQAGRQNFNELLSRLRIDRAKAMLDTPDNSLTIGDIARRVGYDSDFTFRRVFKRCEGMTPTQYLQTRGREISR